MTAEHDKSSEPRSAAVDERQESSAAALSADKRGHIYTLHAREGVNAAELINSALKKRVVGKSVPRRVQVIAPAGPSTAGGKRARQSITLAPVSAQVPALMLGYLDVAQKRAALRSYEHLAKAHKARFRRQLDVTAEELAALLKDLTGMLGTLGFAIVSDEEPELEPGSLAPADEGAGKRNVLIATAVVVAAVGLLFLLR